jgi:hypothetical protein
MALQAARRFGAPGAVVRVRAADWRIRSAMPRSTFPGGYPMTRTYKSLALAAALSTAVGAASAQDFALNWNPRTGDVWVDSTLDDMNRYGYRYREPFVDELVDHYAAPRDLVTDLLVNRRWAPGDVYYACALARAAGRPCGEVVEHWERDNGQGWGAIAKRMGIRPGSPEFHQLKRGFVPTYDRWGRPIRIDDSLREVYPDRGRGPRGYDAIVLDPDRFERRTGRFGPAAGVPADARGRGGPPAGTPAAERGRGGPPAGTPAAGRGAGGPPAAGPGRGRDEARGGPPGRGGAGGPPAGKGPPGNQGGGNDKDKGRGEGRGRGG